jgi:hypothetical protein
MPSPPAHSSSEVFAAAVMARGSNVPEAISGFVGVKVGERTFPSIGNGAHITVVRIKAIVYVSVEAARSTKPWSHSNKRAANEPVGSVIPVGGTAVRGIVKVAIGTVRGQIDASGDLGRICSGEDTPTEQGSRAAYSGDRVNLLHGNILLLAN